MNKIAEFIGRCFKLIRSNRRKLILLGLASAFLMLVAGAAAYYYMVILHPGDHLREENILRTISAETPVYYRDGRTKLGVFFENQHRMYIPFERTPEDLVHALVSAEDSYFFVHFGFNPLAIARAALTNIRHLRVVGGGSTITQQTAKNIFGRRSRTMREKLRELINALRLEHYYSKEKILEFYLNQFYVSGNGVGLGVAARYYFDKTVEQLDLIESAFIAGSVKRPDAYNPFTKSSPEGAARARDRAKTRVGYVLRRMEEEGYIDEQTYASAATREVPFNKGRFTFSQSTILDRVAGRLAGEEFAKLFEEAGIDNVANSGISIVTTIDEKYGPAVESIFRKNISRADVRLNGYRAPPAEASYFEPGAELVEGGFYLGRVASKTGSGNEIRVTVDFGLKSGIIDYQGLKRIADQVKVYKSGGYPSAGVNEVAELAADLKNESLVLTSVRKKISDKSFLLDLEQYPKIQGGVVVLEQGEIRAMVGGFENTGYDRAFSARRQPGSIFKMPLFWAALQLGWLPTDPLQNTRGAYRFQRSFYFPRPDHEPGSDKVSIAWAAAYSENLASIWLLYHLCDRLTEEQLFSLAESVGLAKMPGESDKQYLVRLRDKHGILPAPEDADEILFVDAAAETRVGLIFDGKTDQAGELTGLVYGSGFDEQIEKLQSRLDGQKSYNRLREDELLLESMKINYLRYGRMARDARNSLKSLRENYEKLDPEIGDDWAALNRTLAGFYYSASTSAATARISYWESGAPNGYSPLTPEIYGKLIAEIGIKLLNPASIMIEDRLSVMTIAAIAGAIKKNREKLGDYQRYSNKALFYNRDFRLTVGLAYLISLCRALGVESELEPVLSFPLGVNVVSAGETAQLFAGMVEGKVYSFGDMQPGPALIASIIGRDGEILYRYSPRPLSVVDPRIRAEFASIARKVIVRGTGRGSRRSLRWRSSDPELDGQLARLLIDVPAGGKTGTANRFVNASFAGFFPAFNRDGLSFDSTVTISAYVGYDDNSPLTNKNGTAILAGASGAMPIFSDIAAEIIRSSPYQETVDISDIIFSGAKSIEIEYPTNAAAVVVDSTSGLPLSVPRLLDSGQLADDELIIFVEDQQPIRIYDPLQAIAEGE